MGGNQVATNYAYNDGFTPAVTLASNRRGETVQTVRNGITTAIRKGSVLTIDNPGGLQFTLLELSNLRLDHGVSNIPRQETDERRRKS